MPNLRRPCTHPDCPNRYHMQQHIGDSSSESSAAPPLDPEPSGSRRLGHTYRATPIMGVDDNDDENGHDNMSHDNHTAASSIQQQQPSPVNDVCVYESTTPGNYGYHTSRQSNVVQHSSDWPVSSGNSNLNNQPCPLLYRVTEESTIFRHPNKAAGQFCANSYVGWHQNKRANGYEAQPAMNAFNHNMGYLHSQQQLHQPQLYNNSNNNQQWQVANPCFMPMSHTPSTAPETSSIDGSCSGWQMNKWKLSVLLLVLLIIVSVLVALTIAVAAQVRTHSSLVKLVRQYTAEMVVLDGDLMELNANLLDQQSDLYFTRASEFTQLLDKIFTRSSINAVYESVEVIEFRFLYEIPALKINFLVKTNVEADLSAREIMNVIRQGVFRDVPLKLAVVDLPSISVEGQKWDDDDNLNDS